MYIRTQRALAVGVSESLLISFFYPDKIIISYSFTSKNIGLLTLIKEL